MSHKSIAISLTIYNKTFGLLASVSHFLLFLLMRLVHHLVDLQYRQLCWGMLELLIHQLKDVFRSQCDLSGSASHSVGLYLALGQHAICCVAPFLSPYPCGVDNIGKLRPSTPHSRKDCTRPCFSEQTPKVTGVSSVHTSTTAICMSNSRSHVEKSLGMTSPEQFKANPTPPISSLPRV